MRTPQAVKDAAKFFLEDGAKLSYIGAFNGYEVYLVCPPEDMVTGLPIIYLYKEGEPVLSFQGYVGMFDNMDVFDVIRIAERDTRERRKAARQAKNK